MNKDEFKKIYPNVDDSEFVTPEEFHKQAYYTHPADNYYKDIIEDDFAVHIYEVFKNLE
jgi:hypothetical protein